MQIHWFQKFSLAVTLILLAGFPVWAQQHVSNPFVGATQYINPDYTKEVQAVMATTTDPVLKAQMNTVTTYPTAIWLDRIAAIAGDSAHGGRLGLQEQLNNALTQQKSGQPIVVTLVIYDLPDRDCAARASNGELSIAANPPTQPLDGLTTYEQQYIDVIAGILKNPNFANIRFVLVIEPDSLPNLVTNTGKSFTIQNCVTAQSSGVYVQGVQHAINAFHPIPNAYLYLDIGHSAWLGWSDNASAAVNFYTTVVQGATAGLNSIDGFIDDTANYTPLKEPFIDPNQTFNGNKVVSANFYSFNPTVDEAGYATELQGLFRAAGWPVSSTNFITDTSRNGWGGPNRPTAASSSTDINTFVDASRIDRRNHRGQWCNQSGAGMGIPPLATPPDFPQFQAYVWIKPPGESDGTYPGSANQNGATHADPNCDPAQTNPLAGNTLTGSIANSPPAGQFFAAEFIQNIQNSFPQVPSDTNPTFSMFGNGTSVEQGASASTSITVLPVNSFGGTVALSISGLPTGVTASFNPASITNGEGVSTLTFTAAANAAVPSGPVGVTVTGTSGTITKTTTLQLTIIGRPDFSITAAPPAAVTLTPGQNPTATVNVAALFGFTGTVSISAANLPAGVSANFSPSSVNGSGSIVVNFNAQTSTPAGTTNISIVGTSGSLTHSATIALTIPGAANFSLAATNASAAQGGTGTSTVTVTPSGGFTSSVALSASGLPTGVTASFNPTSLTTGTSTLTFTASSTAAAGATTVTVTGTGGGITHTTTLVLTVTGQPDFSLSANPASVSVTQGGAAASSTITVTPLSGFTGSVTLSVGATPSGVTASLSGNTVTFSASSTAVAGTSTVTITGTSGSLTHTTTISVTVVRNTPDFSLSGSAVSVAQGATGNSTITITPVNGFTGTVTLAASGLPTGVTASFNPASTTTTSTLTFTASSTATTGTTNVTVTGTSGALTHTTTVALTVTGTGNGGVTVTTVINSNSAFFDDEGVKLSNTAAITALSITINVQNTGGLSFNGQYNTVGGQITQSHSSTATVLTYQFSLSAGQTLSPGSGFLFDAQMSANGTAHPTSGDTFTVTYTTGGQTFTQTGHF
ncbi:MAG TPA: glycoside hydrolase family 6 protein [Candidatus Angelobacter sp.]|jgi:cellulose 1,4-beta-cellobiosidase|nr:glycoside hydrolase family 6 protein [Candidatus Angelobacter sp.]